MPGQQSLSCLQLLSIMKNKLEMRSKNETGFLSMFRDTAGAALSEIADPPMKWRTGRRCTGLVTPHNQTYKLLISWSICSRRSSSIICPPVRHHRGSGAAQEPDRVKSFFCTCMTQRLCIHHPVHLWSLLLQMGLFPPSCWWSLGCVCFFLFTFKPADKAQRSVPFADSNQVFSSPRMWFSFYVNALFGYLLPCQHMLCIRLYVLRFTGLYFVQLSGLLITSILSLKCNYVHHVTFLVERHGRLGASPRLWQSFHQWKTKACSEDGWQRLAVFLITTGGGKNGFWHLH